MTAVPLDLPAPDTGQQGPAVAGDAPQDPIRVRMSSVLLVVLALLVVELVSGVLLGLPLTQLGLVMCASGVALFGAVFCFGAITIAGFAAGAAAAGVVVLAPGHLLLALCVLAVMALVCGLAPGWARVEAWQAVRSMPLTSREEGAVAHLPLADLRRSSLPARLKIRWRTDRVVAAFLVLAFPPVFVTGAIAFITWTGNR